MSWIGTFFYFLLKICKRGLILLIFTDEFLLSRIKSLIKITTKHFKKLIYFKN